MSGFGPRTNPTYASGAPEGYVAGIGRGAIGFTTRSDIGPAKSTFEAETNFTLNKSNAFIQPSFGQAPANYVAGRGRGMGDLAREQAEVVTVGAGDRADYSESNYDPFSGYGERLFASDVYDEDDREADEIYDSVDKLMANRMKRPRTEIENAQSNSQANLLSQQRSKIIRPAIGDQFADLKRDLGKVSDVEWDSIPEVGDHSLKLKQSKKKETFMPVPDMLISSSQGIDRSIDPTQDIMKTGMQTQVIGLAQSRGDSLSLKLDKISDSVSGKTNVDPKGYLTGLNSMKISSEAEIGDIKKARVLLGSVTSTNPKHPPGWIAAARVEEFAGKMAQARKIIRDGCEINPKSDDLWLEAARLHTNEDAKKILAQAVTQVPTSVELWIRASELEHDLNKKKIVLRRALEAIPNSVKLWKVAIELEDIHDAKIMLARAVECVPQSVEMWLALAKLETHDSARKILNQARQANPTEAATWITAAKLEEAHGATFTIINRIIEKMMQSLAQFQVAINREQWIQDAEECEHSNSILTCKAIIQNTIFLGVEEEDKKAAWVDDADTCLSHTPPSVETARAIYNFALNQFPSVKNLWLAAAVLEKEHGTSNTLDELLKKAVSNCPRAEVLWLMAAKEKWLNQKVAEAREILMEAFAKNPNNESIWLAAIKLEWENNEIERARVLLSKARSNVDSPKVWLKSALLELEYHQEDKSLEYLSQGISKYPSFLKFYMMSGQIYDGILKNFEKAREIYQLGIKAFESSGEKTTTSTPITNHLIISLWKLLVILEEKYRGVNKARTIMELARLRIGHNDELLLENVRIERRHGNDKIAEALMAKALQENPTSGILWAEDVLTCQKHQQKAKSIDALKKCDNDPFVILAIARLFDKDNKIDKARKWFERAIALSPRLGDAWIYYYMFEIRHHQNDLCEAILKRATEADPNRGELWCTVTKTTSLRRLDIPTKIKMVVEQVLVLT